MTRVFQRDGATFWPANSGSLAIHEHLPPGTYSANIHAIRGYYLEKVADFELPSKLYGDVNARASRILTTFLSRPTGTGVLLSGQKGAGKTMLTKTISSRAQAEHGIITILVNQPFFGEDFNNFLSGIQQPAVVLFDEFEKVYDRDQQPQLLTIFDGTHASKKLFLLTCNDRYRIDAHMLNRPGRLYYAIDFAGLSPEFIAEYCEDQLDNKAHIHSVQNVAAFFAEFSFDMLKALVEEMNRYKESATQAMQMLNMRPQNDTDGAYQVSLMRKGVAVVSDGQSHDTVERSPLSMAGTEFYFYGFDEDEVPEGGLTKTERCTLDPSNLVNIDLERGLFEFGTPEPGLTIRFLRRTLKQLALNYEVLPNPKLAA